MVLTISLISKGPLSFVTLDDGFRRYRLPRSIQHMKSIISLSRSLSPTLRDSSCCLFLSLAVDGGIFYCLPRELPLKNIEWVRAKIGWKIRSIVAIHIQSGGEGAFNDWFRCFNSRIQRLKITATFENKGKGNLLIVSQSDQCSQRLSLLPVPPSSFCTFYRC